MKKLLAGLIVISAILLLGIYIVGERTETEINRVFAQGSQQSQVSKLISYDKQFLKATAISQVTLMADGERPIVFRVTSSIRHYPYKAVIKNKIRIVDPILRKKAEDYFANENWLISTEEINLFAQLTGKLQLLAGRYNHAGEQFRTESLTLDYQVSLPDYSGSFSANWGGMDVQTDKTKVNLTSIKLKSDFTSLPIAQEYDYFLQIAQVIIDQDNIKSQFQDVELQGNSRLGQQENTIDTDNEWKVALAHFEGASERVFTDNHLKLNLKGLYAPALTFLSNASGDPKKIAQALSALMAHGAELSLVKLSSQAPWGEIRGDMQLSLQQGSNLVKIIENPFMLLDYTSGNVILLLPEALLQLPALADILRAGLQTGLLKREDQMLSLDTQLEQGELVVNGRVIPL